MGKLQPNKNAAGRALRYIEKDYLFKLPESFRCEFRLKDGGKYVISSPNDNNNHLLYSYSEASGVIFYEAVFNQKEVTNSFKCKKIVEFDLVNLDPEVKSSLEPEAIFKGICQLSEKHPELESGVLEFVNPNTGKMATIPLYKGEAFLSLNVKKFYLSLISANKLLHPIIVKLQGQVGLMIANQKISNITKGRLQLISRSLISDIIHLRDNSELLKEFAQDLDPKKMLSRQDIVFKKDKEFMYYYDDLIRQIYDIKSELIQACISLQASHVNTINIT